MCGGARPGPSWRSSWATQTTVQDRSYMSAMIPHHSIAILTSENSEIEDVRVCELATKIISSQRQEISEMDWLIDDIRENGPATTAAAAKERPVPSFERTPSLCGGHGPALHRDDPFNQLND